MRARIPVDSCALRDAHQAFQAQCSRNTCAFRRMDRSESMSARLLHATVPRSHTTAVDAHRAALERCDWETPRSEPVTYFHSKRVPSLTLFDLGSTLDQTIGCGHEAMLVTLVLMDRYCTAAKVAPTEHLMHRLYVTCLQIGMKAHSDRFLTNADFAKAAGVSLAELNCCERVALAGMQWRAQVTSEQGICFVRDALAARDARDAPIFVVPIPVGLGGMAYPLHKRPASGAATGPRMLREHTVRTHVQPKASATTTVTLAASAHPRPAPSAVPRAASAAAAAASSALRSQQPKPFASVALATELPCVVPSPPVTTADHDADEDLDDEAVGHPSNATSFCVEAGSNADPETPPNTPVWGATPLGMMNPLFATVLPGRGMAHLRALFRPLPAGN